MKKEKNGIIDRIKQTFKKDPKDSLSSEEFPSAIRERINLFFLFFGVGGVFVFILSIVFGTTALMPCGVLMILFGVYNAGTIYLLAKARKIIDIECVVVDFKTGGYRKQYRYILVQDVDKKTYELPISKSKYNDYQEGDIIRFYTTENDIGDRKDGVYKPVRVFVVEREEIDNNYEDNSKIREAFDLLESGNINKGENDGEDSAEN